MGIESKKQRFEEVYEKESDVLFRYILLRVSNREEALNLLQDAFMKLWQLYNTSEEVDNPKAFIFRVARNAIIDWYRKKKSLSLDSLQTEEGDPIEFKDESVEGDIELAAETSIILKALNRISPHHREAVYLRFMEDLPPKEIAHILNESPNVVSVRISRGLDELRKILNIEDVK